MSKARTPFMLILKLREDLQDPANWTDAARQAVGAHFEMLQREAAAGNMLLAGRSDEYQENGHMHPDVMGIGILLARSREEAEKFVAADPAVLAGVMSVRLHKFNLAVHAGPETWTALSEKDGSSR
jgi:uncharacterized protein YciI